ncbi:MAG: class I SAM-dependent methyltransferase [Euryarchaeota archaeon]|nr:class I SAM-dependent methyltransferase [Euryarchaeota archaeon]
MRGREGLVAWEREYRKGVLWRGSPEDRPAPGGLTLDLGCGDGKGMASILRDGIRVAGLDISLGALNLLRDRLGREGFRSDLVRGDVRHLPFTPGSFDSVVCDFVLGHCVAADREEAVEEVRRVLKPGGRLFFRAFSRRDMRFGKGEEVEEGTFRSASGIDHHFFDEGEVRGLLGGFRILDLLEGRKERRYDGALVTRAVISATAEKA